MKTDNKKETARFKKINKRNTRKKLISFLTALFMILGLSTSIVRAEENESYDYTYRGVEISGNRVVVNGSSASTALFKVGNPDGSISYAYCVDFDTVVENRHNYSRVNVEDANYYDDDSAKHIRAIVRNAYPFISLEEISSTLNLENLTAVEAITATQLAIWKYANAANTPSDLTGNIAAIYNYLINLDGVEGQVSVANIISKDPVIHQNGENCDVEFIFKVDGKNADGTDIDLQYTIEGQSEESNHTNLGVDEEGYTHIKVTNVKSEQNIKFVVQGVQDVGSDVFFYDPEGGRDQSQSLIGIQSGNTNISKTFEFKFTFGEVQVKKVDADNQDIPLKDAEFTIKNAKGEVVAVIITNETGIASAKLLPGSYTIEETKAPEGYVQDFDRIYFTIESNQQTAVEVTAKNTKIKGSIEITKVDEDENPLANAEFVIKNEAGEIVSKAETDENGVVKFTDLPYGKYTYQEITAPEGYVLDNTEYSFEIKENNEIIKASHRNKKENKNTTPTTNTKPINTTTNKNTSTPKTGEIGLAGVVAVLLLAGGGLLVNNRKKKDK